jgi:DNA-binding winged helix-turn-helix (wHTH) protein/tetratricopeptide (TPR) repeat protein/energy-coupling factor transporter ATP-binding protein EcfA2
VPDPANDIHVGDLVVAVHERRAFFREAELDLTAYEYECLAALAAHPGWVYSAEQLATAADPEGDASPFAVNVHISHLRSKLRNAGADELIVTVRGAGWRLHRPIGDGPPGPKQISPPFVGRDAELRILEEMVSAGAGRFGLIVGEPGVGKTTLVEHLLALLAPRYEVIRAVCDGNGSGDHWLWRQLLSELERRTGARISEEPGGHLVAQLLGTARGAGDSLTSGADRRTAYEAVTRYLGTVLPRHSRPVILFVDDLHWADDASLATLVHVLKRLATVPCYFLTACRAADARSRPALRPVMEFATHRSAATLVSLTGLEIPEVAELVRAVLDTDAPGLAERLEQRTRGNPLFLNGYLRALGDAGVGAEGLDQLATPSIASLVRSELAWLPEDTQRLLRFAAVAAAEFRPSLVAEAAGLTSDREGYGFDAAVDATIVVPVGRGMLGFRHALVRDALLEDTPAAELESMHLSVAEAFRRAPSFEGRRVFQLAHHYARAGMAGRERAIGYLVAAARVSTKRFAFEDAIRHLEEVDELLTSAPEGSERTRRLRAAVLERLGGARAALADVPGAVAAYEEALRMRPSGDQPARIRLHTKLGRACINERRRGECLSALNAALAILEATPLKDDAWWRGWIEVRLEQAEASEITDLPLPFDLRTELEIPVLAHGTATQRAKYFCHVANQLSIDARWRVPDEALEVQRQAVAEATSTGDHYLQAYMLSYLGFMYMMRGEPDLAEPHLRHALSMSRHCADSLGEGASLFDLALCSRLRGDVRMTEAAALELATVAPERAPLPEFISGIDADLSWVALRRGNLDEAAERSERALRVWQDDPACSQSVWLMAWPAVSCALARDDLELAVEYATLMTRPDQQALRGDIDSRLAEVIALHRSGQSDAARDLLLALEAEAREYGYA